MHVSVFRVILLFLIPMAIPVADYWMCLSPPCLEYRTSAFITALLIIVVFVISAASSRRSNQYFRRVLKYRWALAGLLLATYLPLFFQFTLKLPDHCHREIASWAYTQAAVSYLSRHPDREIRDYVVDQRSQVEAAFTRTSLAMMNAIFITMWLGFVGSLTWACATLSKMQQKSSRKATRGASIDQKESKLVGLESAAMNIVLTVIVLGFILGGIYLLDTPKAVLLVVALIVAYPLMLAFTKADAVKAMDQSTLLELYKLGLSQIPVIGNIFKWCGRLGQAAPPEKENGQTPANPTDSKP